MKSPMLLPVRKDEEGHYILRMEALKDDGTPVFAEGALQRRASVGQALLMTDFHLGNLGPEETIATMRENIVNLLLTLRVVAGEEG